MKAGIGICKICGKEFEKKVKNQLICSDCRYVTKVCPVCGKTFKCDIHRNNKACSLKCGHKLAIIKCRADEPDPISPATAIMMVADIQRGKTLQQIADRNKWDIVMAVALLKHLVETGKYQRIVSLISCSSGALSTAKSDVWQGRKIGQIRI